MISSTRNPKIKWIRSLQGHSSVRKEESAFIVEGVRLVEEVLHAGWNARLILFTDDLSDRGKNILDALVQRGAQTEHVADHVMRSASDTQTPQGILAVVSMRKLPLPANLNFVVVLDEIRDPGNMGSLLRTANAAGAQAIFNPPRNVDPFSPKVLRSAMGAHFRLPIHNLSWKEIQKRLTTAELKVYLADMNAGAEYTSADFTQPIAIILGGEAQGAGVEARSLAVDFVHIPMPGDSESLNVAIAGALLLFEVVRQRRG